MGGPGLRALDHAHRGAAGVGGAAATWSVAVRGPHPQGV